MNLNTNNQNFPQLLPARFGLLLIALYCFQVLNAKPINFPEFGARGAKENFFLKSQQVSNVNRASILVREDNGTYGEGMSAVLKSLAIPGWGMYTTCKQKIGIAFFLLAPLSYGSIISGFAAKKKYKTAYQDYQNATDQTVMDEKYDLANNMRAAYVNRIGFGVFCYLFQTGLTAIWGRYNDIYRERAKNWKDNVAFNCSPYYDMYSKSPAMNTTLRYTFGSVKKSKPWINI